jgi:hypothetical protein
MVGGCVGRRFTMPTSNPLRPADDLKKDAPALNGTKARASRDPRTTPRRRKALVK